MNSELTEERILSNWADEKVLVSICMLAYNHENYIAEAIDGILAQNTFFGYEILIHDDASTDRTAEIIKQYSKKFPRLIKSIYQTRNQWSRGINPSVFFNYPRAQGDYVAWCEGDDVWTDASKLQIQIDILERERDIDLCFHPAVIENCVDPSRGGHLVGTYMDHGGRVNFDDIFLRRFGMIPTASCVVRRSVMEQLAQFMGPRPYLTSGDVHMQTLGALRQGGYCVNKVMSTYRLGTGSSLTKGILLDAEKNVNHHVSCIRGAIAMWKSYFPHRSEGTLKKLIYKRLVWLFLSDARGFDLVDRLNISDLHEIYISIENYFEKLIERFEGQKVVLFGSGHEAVKIIKSMGPGRIDMVIDRDGLRLDGDFHGVPFGQFKNIKPGPDILLFVTTMFYDEKKLLKDMEICRRGIGDVVRIEDEILELIDVSKIWRGDVLIPKETVFSSGKRFPGWWSNDKEAINAFPIH